MRNFGYLLTIVYSSTLISCYALQQPTLQNQLPMHVDYDTYSFKTSDGNQLQTGHVSGSFASTVKLNKEYYSWYILFPTLLQISLRQNRPYSGWYATFSAASFSFYPPTNQGCLELLKVSNSSQSYSCEYATNGAFFYSDLSTTGSLCKGSLISDGKVYN